MENQDWEQAASWFNNVTADRFTKQALSLIQSIAPCLESDDKRE
jgi:hypothetical protein